MPSSHTPHPALMLSHPGRAEAISWSYFLTAGCFRVFLNCFPLTPKITRSSKRLIPNKDADIHKQKLVRQQLCLYLRKYCSACSLQLFTLAFFQNSKAGTFVYAFFYPKHPCSLLLFACENTSNWAYLLPKDNPRLDSVPLHRSLHLTEVTVPSSTSFQPHQTLLWQVSIKPIQETAVFQMTQGTMP